MIVSYIEGKVSLVCYPVGVWRPSSWICLWILTPGRTRMRPSVGSWHLLCAAAFLACLGLAASGLADEDSRREKKRGQQEQASGTIEIDLSKLPPDLARQLLKYAKGK